MHHRDDVAALRRQGHRLTPQRLMVLEVVKGSGRHLTAEDVHAAVQVQHPFVNIATVYRTLQWLHEVGLVAPIAVGTAPLRYQYMGDSVHHHLVCVVCGGEQEIGDEVLDALKRDLLERYGFAAQLSHLGLTGRCTACLQAEQELAQEQNL